LSCLGRCTAHKAQLSFFNTATYYCCQSCNQSQQFFEFDGQVVAVLDSQQELEQSQQEHILRMNWLARRTLFNFDEVEIVRATDEEVERFAIQVGNDTDKTRQTRYKTMRCLVAAECQLTDNSLRILQRIFGQVYLDH
jgi:hypothetical protein